MVYILLIIAFFVLLYLTVRPPTPQIGKLIAFLGLLLVGGGLTYRFAVDVLDWDPMPARIRVAHWMMEDRFIDFAQVAPGVFNLENVHLIDADAAPPGDNGTETVEGQEWLVFYQYDVVDPLADRPQGPYGAAIYGLVNCRPASILSYELVPVGYSYLGEDGAGVTVENILEHADPLSVQDGVQLDRPEVIVTGISRGYVTDLNLFRKTGVQLNCFQQKQWQEAHPGEAFPNSIRYESVGSFHGAYVVRRQGSTITVVDRTLYERSQITVRKVYQPREGSYFRPGTQVLLEPAEYTLDFGPGEPEDIASVYYPEKTVLAFYQALGEGNDGLDQAERMLSDTAADVYPIQSDPFGLSTDPASPARARSKLDRVLVWEIVYTPDVDAERLRQDRRVDVTLVGVAPNGEVDMAHPCRVTWTVVGVENKRAAPYGCEWRLDQYQSSCQP